MNTNLPLVLDFFPVPPTVTVPHDSAVAEGKASLSPGGACLFSFVVSSLATLLVCALAPVRPISLPSLPQAFPDSSQARWKSPVPIGHAVRTESLMWRD